jgi:hypothetical protein
VRCAAVSLFAAGLMGFFVFPAPIQEVDPWRIDNTSGVALVSAADTA